jgi:hypothetical protein
MQFGTINLSKSTFLILLSVLLHTQIAAQNLNTKQQDSLYLSRPFAEKVQQIKKSIAKAFVNYKGNHLSLFGALSFNKQLVNDKGINAPVNYMYDEVNENAFKTGYTGGLRIDGIYKDQHLYSISAAINKINTGNYYLNKYSLSPLVDDYTHFKADNNFTTLNIALHYKKLLPLNDMVKYKFYAVAGPSIDYKISRINSDNLVNRAGNRVMISGDLGAEFDNNDYYTIYAHYKLGANLWKSTVPVQLNRFEIGMTIKAKDLF